MTFKELDLMPALLHAVQRLGYTEPTPIQQQAIGPVLAGRDLIGCAQTGTGKTAAFAMPILQMLAKKPAGTLRPIRALVLTPTRELALQIKESFDDYGRFLKVRHTVIFGGVGQGPQVEAIARGVDVLVATPGRLNDLCDQGHVDLSQIEYFVLDEADRMLDMGFIHDVRKVLRRLPDKRQTLLFSATMPDEITRLARQILKDPVRVEVTPVSSTVEAIRQSVYKVDKGNKKHLLAHFLTEHPEHDSVLVFTRTKHGADRVVKELGRAGIEAMAIHGNKSQTARVTALERFKCGLIRVLVATDIAARGIDISGLACVVNYELPNIPETYVHRIGRTGRAGRDGVAVSFCDFDELEYLKDIEKLIGKKVAEESENPWPMAIFEKTPPKQRTPRPPREERRGAEPEKAKKEKQTEKADGKKPAPKAEEKSRDKKPAAPKAEKNARRKAKGGEKAPQPEKPAKKSAEPKPEKPAAPKAAPKAEEKGRGKKAADREKQARQDKKQQAARDKQNRRQEKPAAKGPKKPAEIAAVSRGYSNSVSYWMDSLPGEKPGRPRPPRRKR